VRLAGQRIVITRSREQASELAVLLQREGAEVLELPLIAQVPPADPVPVEQARERAAEYDWILFTSANGVRFFLDRPLSRPASIQVCAIGPATARTVEELGWCVDLIPEEYVAESVVAAFANRDLAGKRVLLPRATVARDVVPDALRERGAQVDIVEVYRTVLPPDAAARANAILAQKPDWITFTSSSTVKNLLAVVEREKLQGIRLASIGPVTSSVLAKHELPIDAEAAESTLLGLVEAIARHSR
jgi:uroporphyrinogen III methyltransferase/synthase